MCKYRTNFGKDFKFNFIGTQNLLIEIEETIEVIQETDTKSTDTKSKSLF